MRGLVLISLLCLLLAPFRSPAAEDHALENAVKAAYLYKFGGYVTWPRDNADSPLVIGVAGADGIAEELQKIASAGTAKARPLIVRRIRPDESLAGLDMVFAGPLKHAELTSLLAKTHDLPILTVTDSDDGYSLGSMINFVLIDDKLRFVVALGPASRASLKISALMLAAAYKVEHGT